MRNFLVFPSKELLINSPGGHARANPPVAGIPAATFLNGCLFCMEWKVETDQSTSGLPGVDPGDALRFAVFVALKDQLGLKLSAKKITVQMLVIDNAEKASVSEN